MKPALDVLFRVDGIPVKIGTYMFITMEGQEGRIFKYGMLLYKKSQSILFLFNTKRIMLEHYEECYNTHACAWVQKLEYPVYM